MAPRPAHGPTLLYDGSCRICTAFARLVARWDVRRGLRVVPFQRAEARALVPEFSAEEMGRSAHLVLSGEVLSGPRALPALLNRLPVVGPVHRRLARRVIVRRLVHGLYGAGVALRSATQCAASSSRIPA